MNDDPKSNAETLETEASEVLANELKPEEQEEISGGILGVHNEWIDP